MENNFWPIHRFNNPREDFPAFFTSLNVTFLPQFGPLTSAAVFRAPLMPRWVDRRTERQTGQTETRTDTHTVCHATTAVQVPWACSAGCAGGALCHSAAGRCNDAQRSACILDGWRGAAHPAETSWHAPAPSTGHPASLHGPAAPDPAPHLKGAPHTITVRGEGEGWRTTVDTDSAVTWQSGSVYSGHTGAVFHWVCSVWSSLYVYVAIWWEFHFRPTIYI